MEDRVYFICLGITILASFTAFVSARSIIRGLCSDDAPIVLAISSVLGFVCALPFGNTQEIPWLPLIAAIMFGSIILSTILCCLCKIRDLLELNKDTKNK